MSAMLISNKNLSILTNQIKRDDTNGYRIPRSLKELISGKQHYEVFNKLAEMNALAFYSRYKGIADTERRYFSKEDIYENSVYGEISGWMYKFVRILDSYIYQCTEDDTCEMELYKALTEYRNNWYSYLVRNSKEYADAL